MDSQGRRSFVRRVMIPDLRVGRGVVFVGWGLGLGRCHSKQKARFMDYGGPSPQSRPSALPNGITLCISSPSHATYPLATKHGSQGLEIKESSSTSHWIKCINSFKPTCIRARNQRES